MKTYTVLKREGELLGPVDWSYDFLQHFRSYCCPDEQKKEMCDKSVARLREVAAIPADERHLWQVQTSHEYWHGLTAVGMYDGWPWWSPVPSVLYQTWAGSEWTSFDHITGLRKKPI